MAERRLTRDQWMAGETVTELRAEVERLRSVLEDAKHYVALCPPPPECTGTLRVEMLERRARIASVLEQKGQEG